MNKKAKILFIAPQPFFELRGTPMNVRAMVETLGASSNYEIDLLVFPFGKDLKIPNVSIKRCLSIPFISNVAVGPSFKKLFLDLSLLYSARALARKKRYDLFHGIEEGAFIAGLLAKRESKLFILDMDSCMQTQLRDSSIFGTTIASYLFNYVETWALRRADAVLTVCSALTEKAKKQVPQANICQIEDFPAEGSSEADPEVVKRIYSEFGLSTKEKLVVYTGNFERYQGIDLLLESFAKLPKSLNVRLVLVGGGKAGQTLFDQYKEKARALGVSSEVTFCGNRPLEEMGSFMSLASCLVSPRIEGENTPLKLYSYMASGKPLVATEIYSHTQVLDSSSAFLAGCDSDEFSKALFEALCDSQLSREIQARRSAKALELVEEKYSRKSFDKRLLALYGSLFLEEEQVQKIKKPLGN